MKTVTSADAYRKDCEQCRQLMEAGWPEKTTRACAARAVREHLRNLGESTSGMCLTTQLRDCAAFNELES
jgi:hypothetical protein